MFFFNWIHKAITSGKSNQVKTPRRHTPRLEALEDRLTPSAVQIVPPNAQGLVRVIGTDRADTIDITLRGQNLIINNTTFKLSAVKSLQVGGKAGADTISVRYENTSYNPAISIWGDQDADKIEVWNAAGKSLFVDGGAGNDKLALHGVAYLGKGREVGLEKVWTDANPATIATQFVGRSADELKRSGDLPMHSWVDSSVCCANFVSACLERAGRISANQHQDSVVKLRDTLLNAGWKKTSLTNAKPGDVVIMLTGASHTELVVSNNQGKLTLVGSNNPHGGPQQVGYDTSNFAASHGGYVLTPP